MNPSRSARAAVAIILALAVLIFVLSGTALHTLFGAQPVNPEVAMQWKDVVNVILGALAGFIAGGGNDDTKK